MLILGMGNKFFGDDGVGIVIIEKLKSLLEEITQIKVEETNWGGFRIIDLLSGYDIAIVIDSINTGRQSQGFIHKFDYKDLINSCRMISFHDVNFATAVEFAREIGIPMPERITVYTIEIEEANTFSEVLTFKIESAVDKCIELILADIREHYGIKINNNKDLERIKC